MRMIETADRVLIVLQNLNERNYLFIKFAVMPSAEWFRVLRALPQAEAWITRVKHLPEPVIEYLSVSPDVEVRRRVAYRSALPEWVQRRLAADAAKEVRRELAAGRGTLRTILGILMSDSDDDTANEAKSRYEQGQGRIDDRIARGRSRKCWGRQRYPQWMQRGVDPGSWPDELREQIERHGESSLRIPC